MKAKTHFTINFGDDNFLLKCEEKKLRKICLIKIFSLTLKFKKLSSEINCDYKPMMLFKDADSQPEISTSKELKKYAKWNLDDLPILPALWKLKITPTCRFQKIFLTATQTFKFQCAKNVCGKFKNFSGDVKLLSVKFLSKKLCEKIF